ncbi:hypothetical protein [Roseiconus lacunae]|uniref:Uncharacterized protein n=1 Tax=Roseiconus lacunae TaxID=2605694 RepID=A0ABT7PJY1_9BACT|nr:hypothetical protein [Roseiconus lacunae]MCD0459434.1 hypothetical protein [Roseiconus lacunae]MDM4016780.1 hypothetical protein [Roseiconus lacunae]WRQ50907.1 hypothetical protein U8335_28670 [Stieleria sp. HD01]
MTSTGDAHSDNGERDENARRGSSTIERFFRGVSEFIFHTKLGVADVQLVDYVSDLMLRFVRSDALYSLRQNDGMRTKHLIQMITEADRRIGLAKREVYRHVGDFTLFWSGMYPESLQAAKNGDDVRDKFLDYCRQGKRAYAIAAQIEGGENRPPCELIHRMSEHFEMCAYGLREVRRHWEEDDNGGSELLTW